ncbi:high nitrogen upregulated cytochrome P450 monooxygenase 2 [Mycena polygramma]|nr:high nitrogen upregulated cytochrome P450 monooxygenase 2 [Mycena polygramma]
MPFARFVGMLKMNIPFQDAILSAAACGLTLHLLFNKLEARFLKQLLRLMLVLPLAPAVLLLPHYASPIAAWCVAYGISYATLTTSVLFYRLSPFHPLSKYPGPIFARLSKIWAIYETYTGKTHVTFLNLHRKYGPVVRTGPNEVSICDVSAIQSALGAEGLPKGPIWDGRRSPKSTFYALIGVRDTAVHLRRRRVWNKAFNTSHVKAYEPILRKRVNQLLHALQGGDRDSQNPAVVDLAEWISFFTYDFMGDMAFGGGFELMREGDVNGIWKMIDDGGWGQAYTQHVPWASAFFYGLPGMGAKAQQLIRFVVRLAKTRVKRGAAFTGGDLSSHLLDEYSPSPQPPPLAEYASDAFLAVVAGSDTTATVLCSIFFYILSDLALFNRLRNEIDHVFPRNESQTVADYTSKLAQMPLLNAIINETMRLQPPLPTGLQRAPVAGSGGKLVGSIFIPEGAAVYIPPYAVHRDPRYFSPDPDRFWPERWLESENRNSLEPVQTDRSAFIPYSIGPMNCAGKAMAQLELQFVVATLVQELEMKLDPGWDRAQWEQSLEDFFIFKKGVLPVIIRQRESN